MTELLIMLVSVVVICGCWYSMWKSSTSKSQVKTFTDPVTIKMETPAVDNTPKFSPPVYELEQWIKDNWKKIKVTEVIEHELDELNATSWKIESDVYAGTITFAGSLWSRYCVYKAIGSGLDPDEVCYLKNVYEDILSKRKLKLRELKDQRSRKQLARKLQQLGYGSGEYGSI